MAGFAMMRDKPAGGASRCLVLSPLHAARLASDPVDQEKLQRNEALHDQPEGRVDQDEIRVEFAAVMEEPGRADR